MSFSLQGLRRKYCRSSSVKASRDREYVKSNKTLSSIKSQLSMLKIVRKQLSKIVRQFTEAFTLLMRQLSSFVQRGQLQKQLKQRGEYCPSKLKIIENLETEKISRLQQKIVCEENRINFNIHEVFRELKSLENKSNQLRKSNEKMKSIRKSLGKQNQRSSQQKYQLPPKSTPKKVMLPETKVKGFEYNSILLKKHFQRSSPKFNNNETVKSQFRSTQCSQKPTSSVGSKVDSAKSQTFVLRCPKGHQYYRGQIKNNLPHGRGRFIKCCSQIPLKVHEKTIEYSGYFVQGLFQGKGQIKCKGQIRFEGSFKKGMRHGDGIIYLNGVGEKGYWQQDKLHL